MTVFKGAVNVTSFKPHTTGNTPCWCKTRVPLMVDGVKVGDASIDHTGMMTASITSEVLAEKFRNGLTESISILPKEKAPEVSVIDTTRKF